jgi:hypothetical protein
MEFRNLTPFDAIAWSAEDVDAEESHVIALRVGYRLAPAASGELTHRCVVRTGRDAAALVLEDAYFGEPLASSVRAESDLAPCKSRCDVIVNATAHAPGGEPRARWTAEVRLVRPADGAALLHKVISVCGPRWFVREGAAFTLGEPEPARAVPVRWEHAYGGATRVPEVLLDEVCFANPIGCGWVDERFLRALEKAARPWPDRQRAPQIEDPRRPVTALDLCRHPERVEDARAMAEAARSYAGAPVGLGAVGRAWAPRLARAGTYDDAWQKERWPHLPGDFDFAYWNAAPDDQQIDEIPPDVRIELTNLVDPAHAPTGVLRAALPGHRAVVLLRLQSGAMLPFSMVADTLLIDAEALTVDVVWRAVFPRAAEVRVAEARFETDLRAPLVRFEGVSAP